MFREVHKKNSKFYLHQLKGEAFMKYSINPRTPGQLVSVNLIPRTFNTFFKVNSKLLHHSVEEKG